MKTVVTHAVLLLLAAGCGPGVNDSNTGGGAGGGSAGGGAAGGGAGGSGGAGGGGTAATQLTVAECQQDMDRFVATACSDAATWSTARTSVCPKIPNATAALCADALVRAKTCHAQFQQATLFCTALGQTDTADPCAVDVLFGVLCVSAMNDNGCAAASCTYSTDCPTGWTCNDKTRRCVNTSRSCLGLPCIYSTDCPTGQTCNSSLGQCVRQ